MKTNQLRENEKADFFQNRRWLVLIAGYGTSRNPLYIAYIVLLFLILFYILVMAIFAFCLVIPDKVLMVSACHIGLIAAFVIFIMSSRIITRKSLVETNEIIVSGIYDYEDEDIDKTQLDMKRRIKDEIKKTSDFFSILFATGGLSNLTVFPLTQLIFLSEDDDDENSIYNPYLPPFFIYMPFNTRTFGGYCLAYFINIILAIVLYGITLTWLDIYIHCTVMLKAHLKMLRYSIKNIHNRAYSKCKPAADSKQTEPSMDELFEQKYFQNALYSCIRSNIQHHQALLRFRNALQPFLGAGMLDMYLLVALIYAACLYLILQNLPVHYVVTLVVMLVAEQSNLMIMCILGEAVSQESERLFETLYDIPWMYCNKSFNKAIDIMMCYCRDPLKIKAVLLDKPADIQAYGDFMSAMYKIMSLVRQSDVIS